MASGWNPYIALPGGLRRQLGIGGVAFVLIVWFALSASGWISPNKLPSPVSVVKERALQWSGDGKKLLLKVKGDLFLVDTAAGEWRQPVAVD